MPVVTKIQCECGSTDGWRIDADTAECWECEAICRREVGMPRMMGRMFMNGDGDSGGFYSRQLGRRFHSEKEMIAYAESQGLVPVSGNDKAWTDIKENNREANDVEAQARGFRDSEHQAADIKKHSRDYLATARQKKIDAHHEVHGNEGRQTIEEAFGDL